MIVEKLIPAGLVGNKNGEACRLDIGVPMEGCFKMRELYQRSDYLNRGNL